MQTLKNKTATTKGINLKGYNSKDLKRLENTLCE